MIFGLTNALETYNRLYPLGGQYYEDYSYHQGQTTGIFHAPTSLSGLDTELGKIVAPLLLTTKNYILTNDDHQKPLDEVKKDTGYFEHKITTTKK